MMKKIFNSFLIFLPIILSILLFILTYSNAEDLSSLIIPVDPNLQSYSAIVGRTPDGQWAVVNLKDLGDGKYGLDIGSVSISGTISTILNIDKPIAIEHPNYSITRLNIEIAPLSEYTYQLRGTQTNVFYVVGYREYLEYITWWRPDIDQNSDFGIGVYTTTNPQIVPTDFVLGQENTPIYPPSILKPIFPIQFWNYKIRIINKSSIHTLKLELGIITSLRKIP